MNILDLIVLVLATNHAIEVYHHGSIFAGVRARLEVGDGFLSELMNCMFCLSIWVGAIIGAYYLCFDNIYIRLPVYALAITRGANLLNDLTHHRHRTPGADRPFDEEE